MSWTRDNRGTEELSIFQDVTTRISRHGPLSIVGGSIPRLHSLWRQTGGHVEGHDLIMMGDCNVPKMRSTLSSALSSRRVHVPDALVDLRGAEQGVVTGS